MGRKDTLKAKYAVSLFLSFILSVASVFSFLNEILTPQYTTLYPYKHASVEPVVTLNMQTVGRHSVWTR